MSSADDVRRQRRLLAVLMLAALTVSVQSTLGTPLIPTIAEEQHVSLETAQWVLTVTMLVGAVATPVLGRLGDGPQRRRVLLGALACVCVGSVVAATSSTFTQLILGRALQGIGYGTVPLAIALAREHLTGTMQRSAIAALSITVAVGAGLGFPITGLIAQELTFHAAFWFGAIFSAVAVLAVALGVPSSSASVRRVSLDVPGAVLLGLGLGAALLGISNGETWGWGSGRVVALLAGGVALLAAWALVELRREHPLIDLRLVSQRAIVGANLAAILMAIGMFMGIALVNRLVQTPTSSGYGFSATLVVAGLLLAPLSVGSLISQPLARAAADRVGLRYVLPVGALLVTATEVLLALGHGSLTLIALSTALLGVGIGTTFAAMPALIVANVPPERTGSAMSLNQVLRSAGGAIGSAVGATILAAHHAPGAPFPQESGYTVAFAISAVLCLVTAGLTLWLTPAGLSGTRRERDRDVELLMEESAVSGVGASVFDGDGPVSPSSPGSRPPASP
jgi:MFS family permease